MRLMRQMGLMGLGHVTETMGLDIGFCGAGGSGIGRVGRRVERVGRVGQIIQHSAFIIHNSY